MLLYSVTPSAARRQLSFYLLEKTKQRTVLLLRRSGLQISDFDRRMDAQYHPGAILCSVAFGPSIRLAVHHRHSVQPFLLCRSLPYHCPRHFCVQSLNARIVRLRAVSVRRPWIGFAEASVPSNRQQMGVSIKGGTPKWMVYNGTSYLRYLKMEDLEVPPISGNLHMFVSTVLWC